MTLSEFFETRVMTQAELARRINAHQVLVSQWANGHRRVPTAHCPSIERVTEGRVRCEELRPDVDWAYLRVAPESQESAHG